MKNRVDQVNHLIKEELGSIILREIETSKDSLLTVTKVDTSSNMQIARVYVSVVIKEKEDDALAELKKKAGYIQHLLKKRLKMRPVPKVHFEIDKALEKEQKIYEILADIEKDNKQ